MMADRHRRIHTDAGPSQSQSGSSKHKARLSCESCHHRKKKCDKRVPCSNCCRSGIACVPVERARLPRGRSGKRACEHSPEVESEHNLTKRISRLEQLVLDLTEKHDRGVAERVSSSASISSDSVVLNRAESPRVWAPPADHLEKNTAVVDAYRKPSRPLPFSASPFWANVMNQTGDTDGTLASNLNNVRRLPPENGDSRQLDVGLDSHDITSSFPLPGQDPPRGSGSIQQTLFHLYFQRVDPFFKILHRPSLSTFLLGNKPYLDYESGHPAPEALAFAVYYAAACALSEQECMQILTVRKEPLVARLRAELDSALAKVDYVMTNDLTVLQAFVLSLMSSRSRDQSRRVWTLLGLAVRVAQALSLHLPEPPFPIRPFEREMRRRLWHGIGFLDVETAMDRASEPIMQASWFDSHPLSNVNDSDIALDMDYPIKESEDFTDTTFTIMILKAQSVARSLSFSDFTEPAVKSMNIRQQVVVDFQQTATKLLRNSRPDKIPFHWVARQVEECTNASLQLVSLRPLQRNTSFIPPRIRGDGLLKLAVTVLTKSQQLVNDPRSAPWRWIEHFFVPWHGLAVAIAELCVCEDQVVMEKYWPPVEQAFQRLRDLVADSRKELLWKPIEKIMARAQARRNELVDTQSRPDHPSSVPASVTLPSPALPPLDALPAVAPVLGHTGSLSTDVVASSLPETVAGISPWPNVWDAMEYGDPMLESTREASWLHYENFIGDLHDTVDFSLIPRSGFMG
ncbi:uncharacterized protein CDV56_108293 [Aspergillus thermomutatus]|uniref:Zn(2)-C6 fungal-type domain-containing protein n=1 Tax=Aspergillus thermomutatus TaxID=41047 RepID=A0A397HGR8_ASPTH|nr:uncharacterized protein CDV56_108293 [Aspergillus thermomutatus]RHZ62157.1 hypothetical protein CDV56_108293 [Aspergillus thermomutatus]